MKIGLFITCVNDALFPGTPIATVRVLERLGYTVRFPADQSCCGQMHANSGFADRARPIIDHFARVFESCDAIVAPSGSCVAMVRDQYPTLAPDTAALAARTYELSEFLVDVAGVTDVGGYFPHRVTYHPTCHGLRLLHLGSRPTDLLRAVRGLELIDLGAADQCCGFGGTFTFKNADVSAAMLDDKCRHIRDTGAEVVAAADNSCLVHIGGGLTRSGSAPRAMHYAEILASEKEPA